MGLFTIGTFYLLVHYSETDCAKYLETQFINVAAIA